MHWGRERNSATAIGEWSVIGANAVITMDLPPYSIAVGYNRILEKKSSELKWLPRDAAAPVIADLFMPGIVGIISADPQIRSTRSLDLMVKSMMHEPCYTSGTYTDERLGLAAGWISLKGSFSDCLPIWNEKRDISALLGRGFHGPAFG